MAILYSGQQFAGLPPISDGIIESGDGFLEKPPAVEMTGRSTK